MTPKQVKATIEVSEAAAAFRFWASQPGRLTRDEREQKREAERRLERAYRALCRACP